MVAVPGPDVNLAVILSTLDSKTSSSGDKLEAYTSCCSHLREDELSLFSLDITKNINKLCSVIRRDILLSSPEVAQAALQVLGICLHDKEIVRHLCVTEAGEVISGLCQCVQKTEDKTTCTRALWCIGKQSLPEEVVQKQLHSILSAAEQAVEKWSGQSITVDHEVVNTVGRLIEQVPSQMGPQSLRWFVLLLPHVVHSAIKIRERSLEVLESAVPGLQRQQNQQKEVSAHIVGEFKTKIATELSKLFVGRHEIFVLKCWGVLIQLSGEDFQFLALDSQLSKLEDVELDYNFPNPKENSVKAKGILAICDKNFNQLPIQELHHGSAINHILPIVELGFKSSIAEIKQAAFQAWQQLINNFSTNPKILTDPKRIKLIMQVFKINNAKMEIIAMEKLKVWWHFVWLLGNKLSANFDQVAAPLIQFCVGGSKLGSYSAPTTPRRLIHSTKSPVTPQLNLSSTCSQWPVFPALQLRGCEVLAHFLGSLPTDVDIPEHKFSLDTLQHDVISGPAFFLKQASLFISSATELIISIGADIPDGLLYHIWFSLVAHMKNAIENSSANSDMRDAVTMFLTQFQVIILSRVLPATKIMKMFQAVCCLPRKALCSTAYNISNGEMINGTPALFLTELLLTPTLLQVSSTSESYISLMGTLISCGLGNSTGTLGFLQSVLQLMDQNSQFIENPELVWRFWSSVVNPLHEHITKTNEVNQGDALEHKFDCLYQSLMFPITHKLPERMPQPTVKTLTKTWSDLYKTFARLSALVTNAEANIVCQDLCHRLVETCRKEEKQDGSQTEVLVQFCVVIVGSIDFSSLGTQSTFNLGALSPAKWTKKRLRPLENIHSLVHLLSFLQNRTLQLVSNMEPIYPSKGLKSTPYSVQGMLNNLVEVFNTLFTHVTSSSIISSLICHLSQPIGELFHASAKKTTSKLFNAAFQQKLEKLWLDISTCLQSRYTGGFDSDFLQKISPLLESTFLHPRRQIKNQTLILWNNSFSKAPPLTYPESLRPVLMKVKEKSPLALPGWVNTDIPVIAETPVSQMSQAGSQAPDPHIPGMPSPHKIHGSFLNKAVSPNIKKSPAKPSFLLETRAAAAAATKKALPFDGLSTKKALPFDGLTNDDFVVIKSPPTKRRVLTEHQKEVLRERRALPAMYNSLEHSQDASLMLPFNTDTQSDTPTPTSDSVLVFGTHIPTKTSSNQAVNDSEPIIIDSEKSEKSPDSQENRCQMRQKAVRFADMELSEMSGKSSHNNDDSGQGTRCDKRESKKELSTEKSVPSENTDCFTQAFFSLGDSSLKKSERAFGTTASTKEVISEKSPKASSSGRNIFDSLSPLDESVPQNLLGALGNTYESSNSKTGSGAQDVIEETFAKEKTSDPLLSWSQKLSELNESPAQRSQLPDRKSPISNKVTSPQRSSIRRQSSQLKSPRRSRQKKEANENEGNLDKWIILSPRKEVDNKTNSVPVTNTLTVGSVAIVEETQSPKKLGRGGGSDVHQDSPTINETPPKKNGLFHEGKESKNVSNRKLFSSQENVETNVVEDSNLVPGSPVLSLKSSGTPVLKLKRLTNEEILHYSPSSRDRENKSSSTSKKSDVHSQNQNIEETSHEHDDFSEIKPLEENQNDPILQSQEFIPSSESDPGNKPVKDFADLVPSQEELMEVDSSPKTAESSKSESQSLLNHKSGKDNKENIKRSNPNSEVLFSEVDSQSKLTEKEPEKMDTLTENLLNENGAQEDYDPFQQDTMKDPALVSPTPRPEKSNSQSGDSQQNTSDGLSENEGLQNFQVKDYDPLETSTLSENSQKQGRKRKQATPQKNAGLRQEINKERQIGTPDGKKKLEETGNKTSSRNIARSKYTKDPVIKCKGDGVKTHQQGRRSKRTCGQNSMSEEVCMKSVLRDSDNEEMDQIIDRDYEMKKTKMPSPEQLGERTPESRNSLVPPERKSTTKQKKALAQRRSLKRGKDVLVNEGDYNLDSDSSGDNNPLISVKSTTAKETSLTLLKDTDSNKAKEKLEDRGIKSSVSSDDEIPLAQLSSERQKKSKRSLGKTSQSNERLSQNESITESASLVENKDDRKTTSKEEEVKSLGDSNNNSLIDSSGKGVNESSVEKSSKFKKAKVSPMSQRLRSSGLKLRTRNKILSTVMTISPKRSLSLSLKKDTPKREKVTEEKKEADMEVGKTHEGEKVSLVPEENSMDKEKTNEEKSMEQEMKDKDVSQVSDGVLKEGKKSILKERSEVPSTPSTEHNQNPTVSTKKFDALEETPRKASDSPLEKMVSMAFSDSKLIMGSRSFRSSSGFARRSILKHSAKKAIGGTLSPLKQVEFHPIRITRVLSPTASPSASILKKRRLSEDANVDSASPPAKQRRVSFADPLIEVSDDVMDIVQDEGCQPLSTVIINSESKVIPATEKTLVGTPSTTPVEPDTPTSSSTSKRDLPFSDPCSLTPSSSGRKDLQPTQSQNTYQSTQESQLNNSEPICPDLLTCPENIEKVLPQLTSSIWSRGLGQLVRARNIHTIGDLSALTESEVHNLPIRSPKVATVRKALYSYKQLMDGKRAKMSVGITQEANQQEQVKGFGSVQPIEETAQTQQIEMTKSDLASSIDEVLASTGDLLDEVNRLSQTFKEKTDNKTDTESSDKDCHFKADLPPKANFLTVLAELVQDCSVEDIQKMKTEEIFQMHQHIITLQNHVVSALRLKCSSPTGI